MGALLPGYLLATIDGMDKYEQRRLRLQELIQHCCGNVAAELARRIDREPNYVTRMLYPAGKKGRKRIADDMIELLEKVFDLERAWFDLPLGTLIPNTKVTAAQTPPAYIEPDPRIAEAVALMTRADSAGRDRCLMAIRIALAIQPPGDAAHFERRTGT